MKNPKVINFFGGPGCGKSTMAASLFALMKENGDKVELVTEFAKDMVWENNTDIFTDQLYIIANQNHRLHRLRNHDVDYIVTDSALLLSYQYAPDNYLNGTYLNLLLEINKQYDNLNFFIERGERTYAAEGRLHSESESKNIDKKIETFLLDFSIPYARVLSDSYSAQAIYNTIKEIDKK